MDEVIGYFIESELVANLSSEPGTNVLKSLTDEKEDAHKNTILNLFANANEGVAIVGLNGVFLEANEAFCKITGYTKAC